MRCMADRTLHIRFVRIDKDFIGRIAMCPTHTVAIDGGGIGMVDGQA